MNRYKAYLLLFLALELVGAAYVVNFKLFGADRTGIVVEKRLVTERTKENHRVHRAQHKYLYLRQPDQSIYKVDVKTDAYYGTPLGKRYVVRYTEPVDKVAAYWYRWGQRLLVLGMALPFYLTAFHSRKI